MGARSRVSDPLQKYRFLVSGLGLPAGAGFQKVSGLGCEKGIVEYNEGGFKATHKIPGREKYSDVTLERGLIRGSSILTTVWDKQKTDATTRFDMVIQLQTPDGQPSEIWTLCEAWISKWEGPELDANSDDVAVEKITVTYEYMLPKGG